MTVNLTLSLSPALELLVSTLAQSFADLLAKAKADHALAADLTAANAALVTERDALRAELDAAKAVQAEADAFLASVAPPPASPADTTPGDAAPTA